MNARRAAAALVLALLSLAAAGDRFERARQKMVADIEADVRLTSEEIGGQRLDARVMQVMASTPRHLFVPPSLTSDAYLNRPLPIGYGQTISQPYIVALMTDLLRVQPADKVLEIGTGSGYQAAILSKLVGSVFTIEIIPPLATQARMRLSGLGYRNVQTKNADGYYGWEEHAPFDAIIVTAAASHVPAPLLKQLKPGGRMVIPVGSGFAVQQLMFIRKTPDGKVTTRQVIPVVFVPLTGKH